VKTFHFWGTICKTVCPIPLDCCLSVTLVYCGQTVGPSSPESAQQPPPLFGPCGQMAGWIKMPLGTEVGLGPGHIVLDEDPAPFPQKGAQQLSQFRC